MGADIDLRSLTDAEVVNALRPPSDHGDTV
jgi:hypothetical protein